MNPSILNVAAEAGVVLEASGNLYKACCPFHAEKAPSCLFYPDTNSFYCWGCAAGGDVVEFTKLIYNIPYMEAVKKLGIEANLFSTNSLRSKLQGNLEVKTLPLLNKYYLVANKILHEKNLSISKEAKLIDNYYELADTESIKNLLNKILYL
jgi:DNA primase